MIALPRSEAADDFQDIEGRLLSFETFRPASSAQTLDSLAVRRLSSCDTHSQRAMLLLELPLAVAALRSGAADEFDQHIQSLEIRSKTALSCTPRESFFWLLVFNLEILHGRLTERSFDLLAMSYETSPNEAWISIRRIAVALPLVLVASEPIRQRILNEFQQLIKNGFLDVAVHSYATVSGSIRSLLQAQVEQLEPGQQKAFAEALHKFGS